MNRLLKLLKKLPETIQEIRLSLNKDKYDSIDLMFQDETRFGLMTYQKRTLTAKSIEP